MLVSAVQRESAISIHLSPPSWACLPPPSPVFSFLIRLEKFHKGSRNLLDQSVPDGLNSPLIHQNRISWHSPQPASLEQTLGAIWSAVSQATVFILPQNNTWFASFTLYFFFFLKSAHSWTWTWFQSHWAGRSQSIAHKRPWWIQTIWFLHDSRRALFFKVDTAVILYTVRVAQSCLTLCDCMDRSPPGSSVHSILQARILEWVTMPFSRGSSRPRDLTRVSCIAGEFFYPLRHPGKPI